MLRKHEFHNIRGSEKDSRKIRRRGHIQYFRRCNIFSGKFEILFYAKKEMSINGYLVMRNKPFYFEIRIYKLKSEGMFTIGVTVGKTHVVKKVTGVI
jgi:hypothetical protein